MIKPADEIAANADRIAFSAKNCYTMAEMESPRQDLVKLRDSTDFSAYCQEDAMLIARFINATETYFALRETQILRGEAGKTPYSH